MVYAGAMAQAKGLSREVGALLRAYREARGLRQDEVARAAREGELGWTRATVAAIETGKRELSLSEFFALRGSPLQAGELDGERGLLWYASQDRPIRRGKLAERLDAETKAAAKLGVEPSAIVAASYHLWGRTLTEERDRVVKARESFDEMAKARYGAETPPTRTLQAHRGHVTRRLVVQIGELLRDPSFDPGGGPWQFRKKKRRGKHAKKA